MPGKNLIRYFAAESFYHIYNRGVDKRQIFLDYSDYQYFISLFGRHLGSSPAKDNYGRESRWFGDNIDLLAYCLMPNHFHMFVFQGHNERSIADLMQSIGVEYTMYFNKKYGRKGALFETTYKASLIENDAYFSHISRYIHLNPEDYKNWKYSSYGDYVSGQYPDWLRPSYILDEYKDGQDYSKFVADYRAYKEELADIKPFLADA